MMTLTSENKEYAVIPMADYELMSLLKEDYDDALSIEKVKQEIELKKDELIPLEQIDLPKLKLFTEVLGLSYGDLID